MTKTKFAIILLASMMLATSWNSNACCDLISINPSQDNSMYSENNNSNGAGQGIFVGRTADKGIANSLRRGLIQFDIAGSIPAGSIINSVTLSLTKGIAGPESGNEILELRPLTVSWGEGTSFGVGKGAPPSTNDATWNYRFFSSQLWNLPGGDFGPTSGTTMLDTISSVYTFNSQAGMVTDVQNWLNNPSGNFGWLLKYEDEATTANARMFGSRQTGNPSDQPTLTVSYSTVPEPSSFLLLTAVSMIISTRRPNRRRSIS